MSSYSAPEIAQAAGLVHRLAALPLPTLDAAEENVALTSWLEGVLEGGHADVLAAFLRQCGPAGTVPYGLARSLLRNLGSVFDYEGQPRVLFALPLALTLPAEATLGVLECRQAIERELELAKNLPFLSLRLCQHPVRRVDLDELGPLELGRVGRDLVRYSQSKRLQAPRVGPGPENLLWLGVYRLPPEEAPPLFGTPAGLALQGWRGRCRQWLEMELAPHGASGLDLLFPMRVSDALSASRLVQLKNELLAARAEVAADWLGWQRHQATVRWVMRHTARHHEVHGEAWLPDEHPLSLAQCFDSVARRHHLTLSALPDAAFPPA